MRRRQLFTGAAGAAVAAAGADWSKPFAKAWRDTFLHHWADTKAYTLAMLDAMPADGFDSKPNSEQRSYGEQFVHIARANNAYATAFGIGKPPEPPAGSDKASVRKFVVASFDWITGVLGAISQEQLLRTDYKFSPGLPPHSGTDLLMRAYMHTAHHRGQAVVYLRVRNIVPPAWKFEPTGA